MNSLKSIAIGLCAAATGFGLVANEAAARELDVPPSVPPGHSLGFPIGIQLPPGVYLTFGADYITGDAVDDNGDEVDQSVEDFVIIAAAGWVPGFELFGGQYSAGIQTAYINREIDRGDDFPNPFQAGTVSSREGLGRITIQPIRLSWNLGQGRFVSTGFAFQTPIGDFDPADSVQLSGDFWTFIPDVAFTWMTPEWETTIHASYFISTENDTTDYQSGDEFSVNFTALRKFDNGWAVGPLAYYATQVTDDENNSNDAPNPDNYFGMEFDKYETFGVGIGVRRQVGPLLFNANLTQALDVSSEIETTIFQFRVTVPLGPPPPPGGPGAPQL